MADLRTEVEEFYAVVGHRVYYDQVDFGVQLGIIPPPG
jgi:hypothetical protein